MIEPASTSHTPLRTARATAGDAGVDVRLFHDPPLRGTRATVRLSGDSPDEAAARQSSQSDASEASCWVWLRGENLHVRCYNNGVPVRFCGHGLLASAHVWTRERPAATFPLRLHSAGAVYTLTRADGGLWLHCPRIPCRVTPDVPRHWFDHAPEHAALAGDDDGYWILRWPAGFDLAQLQPRLSTIARDSHRAVIATAAGAAADCDAQLRYFAPAHGNPEDSVTGSAAVVLADYWQRPTLRLQQCSPRGGRLEVRLTASDVALGGRMEENHR